MKIYIAGPISGKSRPELISSFGVAADDLRDLGHSVVNPVDMSGWGLSWEAYMRIAETILRSGEIDGILMLEGWERSKSARLEHAWAMLDKIPIYYEKDGIHEAAKLKERAERPYDAMGDDQGRGGSAETRTQDPGDSWYRENFKPNCSEDALIKAIKRGDGTPREVKK